MSNYVLRGLSEETRDAARREVLEARRREVAHALIVVSERLDESRAKRRARVEKELWRAKNELGRVNQQLSADPYNNASVPRLNQRNRSSVAALAFRDPGEPVRSSTTEMLSPRLLSQGAALNAEGKPFAKARGQFSTEIDMGIKQHAPCERT